MQEMDILKHIKLTTEEGKNITGVFFDNQYELWNKDRTEVTLIVDPGRVKLGLLANNKMGRAFDERIQQPLFQGAIPQNTVHRKINCEKSQIDEFKFHIELLFRGE